jgi:hypothetical protein
MPAVIVPPSGEAWQQEQPFRVEYLNRALGSRALIYFAEQAGAAEFAAANVLWNQPCVVQSRDMPCTHEVRSVAVSDPGYTFWTKKFGNLESAQAEFDLGRAHAAKYGGSYLLFAAGETTPMAVYAKLGNAK